MSERDAVKLTRSIVRCALQDGRELSPANSGSTGNLYTFIYQHTWELLDDTARGLLLDLLDISPDGEDTAWLRGLSGLSISDFENALARLLHYSLVEVTGRLVDPRYHLHRLTVTFLRTDLMQQWNAD